MALIGYPLMSTFIAIIGRPNVGKSTLFNRLARSKDALVDDQPGVTRDRLYASVQWDQRRFTIIDTGGFEESEQEPLLTQVRSQVVKAVQEADRVVFMVDGRQGVMPGDEEMAKHVRLSEKRFFLAVNKVDGPEHEHLALDFYRLGVAKTYPVSAAHGYGLKDLMQDLVADLPTVQTDREDDGDIRVAVMGRPNVGKSSLLNRILGFERLLVSEMPGTTRDSVDVRVDRDGKAYRFIDTAGLRRRSRVKERIEKFSMIKALRSLERADVIIVLLDAAAGIADQDARISGFAFERGRALIIAFNKWDLVARDKARQRQLQESYERQLRFASFAPTLRVSALTGEGVERFFGKIDLVFEQYCREIGTPEINRALRKAVDQNPPPKPGRGGLKLYYAVQKYNKPPTFLIFVNDPQKVHFSYRRYLIRQFREHFRLDAIPLKLIFRKKNESRRRGK
jgi:GTP-binding protein